MIGGTDWKGGEERSVHEWIFIIIIIIFRKTKGERFSRLEKGSLHHSNGEMLFFLDDR